jgi:hypothetical protein
MSGGGFPASAFAQAFGGGGRGGMHVHEINPEEIFNMFFHGQGMNGFRATRGGQFREQQRHEREEDRRRQQQQREPPSLFMQFLQFLPIIILFVMSMQSFGGSAQPTYTFTPQGNYRDSRKTSAHGAIPGIPYYVQPNFLKTFKPGSLNFQRLETSISTEYRDLLAQECGRERQRRNTMMARVSACVSRTDSRQTYCNDV